MRRQHNCYVNRGATVASAATLSDVQRHPRGTVTPYVQSVWRSRACAYWCVDIAGNAESVPKGHPRYPQRLDPLDALLLRCLLYRSSPVDQHLPRFDLVVYKIVCYCYRPTYCTNVHTYMYMYICTSMHTSVPITYTHTVRIER